MSLPHGRPKEGALPLGGKARSAKGAHNRLPHGRPKEGSLPPAPNTAAPATARLHRAESILDVDAMDVAYGKVEAVHGVTLSVPAGAIVSVIGPNGAGKTTLLGAIMGLLPSRGVLRYRGHDATRLTVEQRVEQGLILVPERRELFGAMTVAENLELGAFQRARRFEAGWRSTLEEVFSRFPRLLERRGQLAGTLSGGERQMLAMGRALMGSPRLLMLDEPSLGLAPLVVREIFSIITALRTNGVSILLIEQNARAALQVSDYGYVLETGEVSAEGRSDALAADPRVAATYLGRNAGAAVG